MPLKTMEELRFDLRMAADARDREARALFVALRTGQVTDVAEATARVTALLREQEKILSVLAYLASPRARA